MVDLEDGYSKKEGDECIMIGKGERKVGKGKEGMIAKVMKKRERDMVKERKEENGAY